MRGNLNKCNSWRVPLTRTASRSDLSPKAGRGEANLYFANCSFSHATIILVMFSAGIPGVRPMWWPSG